MKKDTIEIKRKYKRTKKKNRKKKKQRGGMEGRIVSGNTNDDDVVLSDEKRLELAKSLYGTPKTDLEITDDYLNEHMDNYGVPFTGTGKLYKYRLDKKLEEGKKERKDFDTMIDTMKKRDELLDQMEPVGLLDLPHQIEEFDGQDCNQIGRLCKTNKQYRDYCADDKINYKYIVPCKINYDIKQLLKHIIEIQDISMSQGGDPLDKYSNISELDIFTYLKAYLSWSIFEVADYQIVVKLDTQTRKWGFLLPEPARNRNWSDLLTEEDFMDYVSSMDPETILSSIQGYIINDAPVVAAVKQTLSMYETGSLSWWTTALMCETYARPVLNVKRVPVRMEKKRRIGMERLISIRNRLLDMLFSLEKKGFDAFNGVSNREGRGAMASIKDVYEAFYDISLPQTDGTEIHKYNSTHKELFLKDGLQLFESDGFNKTILSEYFHEYLYLFNFSGDDTNYEYLPHMDKFKRPWQIEYELKQAVEKRFTQDLV